MPADGTDTEPLATASPVPPPATQLRFSLPPAAAAAIAAGPLLDPPPPAARARHLTDTWYDTPALTLLRHGFALSVAKARRGYVQTLRQNEMSIAAPLMEALPDPAAFGPGWEEPLANLLQGEIFAPAFSTQVKRVIRQAGGVELRFESGFIQTRTEKLPFTELELSGHGAELYHLALTLAETHGLILQPSSLMQRGIWASGALRPAAVKAGPGLSGPICLDDAVAALTQSCCTQFTANWPVFTLGTEVEAVHQMRVAMRRLRSVLGLFNRNFAAPEFCAFRDEAKLIANLMGEARNWDVFTALLQAGPIHAFPHEAGFAAMLSQCAEFRAVGYDAVRKLLASPATTCFLLKLELFLSRHGWRNGLEVELLSSLMAPAQEFAAANLARLHRKVRKRGKNLMHIAPHERHLTRIELKKLRYAADLFGGLFEAKNKIRVYNRIAAELQEELGLLNDLATAQELLTRLDGTTPDKARAIGIVLGWCAQAASADDRQLAKRWKAFTETKPFA
jgi:inorganic triphosphatase YgiF